MVLFEYQISNQKMALRMLVLELIGLVVYLLIFMPHFLNYIALTIFAFLIVCSLVMWNKKGGFLARVTPTEVIWNSGGLTSGRSSFCIQVSSIARFEYQQGETDAYYLRLKNGQRRCLNLSGSGIDIMAFAKALEKLGISKVRTKS